MFELATVRHNKLIAEENWMECCFDDSFAVVVDGGAVRRRCHSSYISMSLRLCFISFGNKKRSVRVTSLTSETAPKLSKSAKE